MKVVTKICLLFALLVGIGAGLTACDNVNATNGQKTEDGFPKGDYPPAPPKLMEAKLTRLDGTTFSLNEYKGKVIIVNAWATWCGPCRQEMPEFVKLQDELKDKGFEIIGLNIEDEESLEVVKDFGKEMEITYPLVKGSSELFVEFLKISKKQAIPQSFLIDRDGKLVGVFVGGGGALKRLIDGSRKLVNS